MVRMPPDMSLNIKYPSRDREVNTQVKEAGNRTMMKPKRPYDPTDNKGRGYRYRWAVYPDYWKDSWGQVPLLGYVRADSEFHAKYAAYDAGLLPVNCTFGPKVIFQEYKPFNRSGNK